MDKCILETTHPHKHVTIFCQFVLQIISFIENCGQVNSSVDEWILEVTRPLDEWLKILNETPVRLRQHHQPLFTPLKVKINRIV